MHVCVCTCMYARMHICLYFIRVSMCVWVYVCIDGCTHDCMKKKKKKKYVYLT